MNVDEIHCMYKVVSIYIYYKMYNIYYLLSKHWQYTEYLDKIKQVQNY